MKGKFLGGTIAILLLAGGAHAQTAEFTGLGVLPGSSFYSLAYDVSGDGSVVVGYSSSSGLEAFRWTQADGMVGLGYLPGGSSWSEARGVNSDGSVIVGVSYGAAGQEAFRWTQADGMVGLGDLPGGAFTSEAWGVSNDGSVVVGRSIGAAGQEAFRWTQADGMVGLGDLPGGTFSSQAYGISGDGSVIVGASSSTNGWEAFRWTQAGGMVGLGDLPGGAFASEARGANGDGSVVVGFSNGANGWEAFRWTQTTGMVGLGDLPGGRYYSVAYSTNSDGSVIVGSSISAAGYYEAFRWTQETGMQSVIDWLADNGVTVENWILSEAYGVSDDGSVIVGVGTDASGNTEAWIARVSGVIMPSNFNATLANIAAVGPAALNVLGLYLNGLHGRPVWRRRGTSRYCSWAAGDFGRDSHGQRNGNLGLGEIGLCWRPKDGLYFSVSAAYTGFNQKLPFSGRANGNGVLLSLENQIRVTSLLSAPLWLVTTGAAGWADLDIRRGYLNAGNLDSSKGDTSYTSMGGRFRLEWENAFPLSGAGGFTPHIDLSILHARIKGYTETGGGFPARFDAMSRTVADLRVGLDYEHRLTEGVSVYAGADYVHRFGKMDYKVSGEVLGLFDFSGLGYTQYEKRNWAQFRLGMEAHAGPGVLNFAANATTKGATPSWWLNVGYRVDL